MIDFYYCEECEAFLFIRPIKTETGSYRDVSHPSSVENISRFMSGKDKLPICCGKEMTKLEPNTEETSGEKHIPVVKIDGKKISIKVGAEPHPMTDQHHIVLIVLETKKSRYEVDPYVQQVSTEVTFEIPEDDEPLPTSAAPASGAVP